MNIFKKYKQIGIFVIDHIHPYTVILMQEDIKEPKTPKENEIDLGVFFGLIEKIFRKIGILLSSFFLLPLLLLARHTLCVF